MENRPGDAIDAASKHFKEFLPKLKEYVHTICSEQDTRLKIIDPIFTSILQWHYANISTEEYTGEGFVDYKFSVNGLARMIVEAKKDSVSLGLANRSGRTYKLSGPILSLQPQPRSGINQAVRYCGAKNAELACVTNGNEWIIFRGSRLGDGRDTLDGMAFIFVSLDDVSENFKLFYDLMSYQSVESFMFRSYFQEAEGQPIRAKAFSRTLKPVSGYRLIQRSGLSVDLDRVMTTFFRRISGDDEPDMLAECFVVTKESQIADERLARITDELASSIRDLETEEAKALTQIIERVRDTQRNEFVLLIGTKGAGKSTFTDRFFRYVLPENIRNNCVIIRLNVGESPGDPKNIHEWLNEHLLKSIEMTVFGIYGPTYEELQGIFFDEYIRWTQGPYKHLYEVDKTQFKMRFGENIEQCRSLRLGEYINRLLRNIVTGRRKIPCLVFDNTDHFSIEFQEMVFQYARSLYENEICLIVIPITDKTSWQLSRQGALQSFDSEAFFLPTPPPKIVLEKRISFIEKKLNERQIPGSGYFLSKGIRLSLEDLQAFTSCLQNVFLNTGLVAKWVGNLANNDIRRCLHLVRDIIASPYMKVDELIKAYMYQTSILVSEEDIKKSIILKGYNFYPTGQNEFVQNLFSLSTEVDTTPLLALRILRLLRDAKHHDAGGLEDFVAVEQVLDYLHALGIDRRTSLLCLDAILKSGLCFSYDPTVVNISNVKKIQLSPSGLQHLHWGAWDEIYIAAMLSVTPIPNEDVHHRLMGLDDKIMWKSRVAVFLEHLLTEDAIFCSHIDHPAYVGQQKLIWGLSKKRDLMKR
ncbi:MAG: ATP-binding protein [Syntrophobacteraceae bacterium]